MPPAFVEDNKLVNTEAIIRGRWGTAALAVVVVAEIAVLLTLAAGAYFWAGWHRMESACQPSRHGGVSYSWSWSAPGFTCTSADGYRVSRLWW